ncbi:MAG TPA: GNAT family N-acetyltransferase [Blastococcus sp.]|nr:GNAT family N-acetyltransferase [Blastococcus sp.]
MTRGPGGIRVAHGSDLPLLREVERAAGSLFAPLGMHLVAEDDPPTVATLAAYQEAGRAWVRTDAADRPVGYLLADVVDGCAHLEQVSVHPAHAHQGLGRGLIGALTQWAEARGLPAITLTTYVDVPWNGPYYERLGFRFLGDEEVTPGLRRIRRAEAERGLDRWPRAAMRRELRPRGPSG